MGFSVSGSTAIVFVGVLISTSMFYTAASNGFERLEDSRTTATEKSLEQHNTDINVTEVTLSLTGNLTVEVNNTGSTALEVENVDLLVDNHYQEADSVTLLDDGEVVATLTSLLDGSSGSDGTDLWLPGETLRLTANLGLSSPNRVKVVVGPGVAETEAI